MPFTFVATMTVAFSNLFSGGLWSAHFVPLVTEKLQTADLGTADGACQHGPAMQDLDQRLGLKPSCDNIPGLRNHNKPVGVGDWGGLLARPRQVLCKRCKHGSRHHRASLPP